jgi:hypothetical protein
MRGSWMLILVCLLCVPSFFAHSQLTSRSVHEAHSGSE